MFYFGITIFVIYLVFKVLYIYFPLKRKKQFEYKNEVKCNKSFAILVPAYNEKDVILNCVQSLINIKYGNYRVYIINDGSDDNTFPILNRYLSLIPIRLREDNRLSYQSVLSKFRSRNHPNIFVINKENGGKADALNAGISCCSEDYVITLDADCMLKEDSIGIMNRVFQNENIVAAGGTVHIIQNIGDKNHRLNMIFNLKNIIKYQVVQYLTSFYLYKYTQSIFNALIVISGAYGAFKRSMLIEIDGYRKSVGEDMDITLKVHKYIKANNRKYLMTYVPQSICYTECPENLKNLTKQRIRWQKAFVDCTIKHGLEMFRHFNTAVSLFFIFDCLILGTLTSIMVLMIPLSFILTHKISLLFIVFFSADFFLGITESIVTIIITKRYHFRFSRKDFFRLCFFIPFQQISYKFLNILYVILGTCSYFINKNHWNKAERLGRCFSQPLDEEPVLMKDEAM